MALHCENCGSEIKGGNKFCESCGSKAAEVTGKSKSFNFKPVLIGLVALLVIGGAFAYFNFGSKKAEPSRSVQPIVQTSEAYNKEIQASNSSKSFERMNNPCNNYAYKIDDIIATNDELQFDLKNEPGSNDIHNLTIASVVKSVFEVSIPVDSSISVRVPLNVIGEFTVYPDNCNSNSAKCKPNGECSYGENFPIVEMPNVDTSASDVDTFISETPPVGTTRCSKYNVPQRVELINGNRFWTSGPTCGENAPCGIAEDGNAACIPKHQCNPLGKIECLSELNYRKCELGGAARIWVEHAVPPKTGNVVYSCQGDNIKMQTMP